LLTVNVREALAESLFGNKYLSVNKEAA